MTIIIDKNDRGARASVAQLLTSGKSQVSPLPGVGRPNELHRLNQYLRLCFEYQVSFVYTYQWIYV